MHTVSGLSDARAALAAGAGALISPPFAGCHAGVSYWRSLLDQLLAEYPAHRFTFTLCCGDNPAIAHDALRLGFSPVRVAVSEAVFAQLAAAAKQTGAVLIKG